MDVNSRNSWNYCCHNIKSYIKHDINGDVKMNMDKISIVVLIIGILGIGYAILAMTGVIING